MQRYVKVILIAFAVSAVLFLAGLFAFFVWPTSSYQANKTNPTPPVVSLKTSQPTGYGEDAPVITDTSVPSQSTINTAPSPGKTLAPSAIYANSKGAVAIIETGDDLGYDVGLGSGFFIDPNWVKSNYKNFSSQQSFAKYSQKHPNKEFGYSCQDAYLLTNYHVIKSAATAHVQLNDGRSGYVDHVVMENEDLDLALVNCTISNSPEPVAILQIAKGSETPIGARVYAIGSPNGLEASLSEGIISGNREIAPGISRLQTTASISPGSSGGPLLDTSGEVVGLTQGSLSEGQNLNFAIPASNIIKFLKGSCNSREIWRGRSIKEEEEDAYSNEAVAHSGTNDQGKFEIMTGILLKLVYNEIKDQSYTEAMKNLNDLTPSQFGEYEYLVHYTIGLAEEGWVSSSITSREGQTLQELFDRYRKSKHHQLAKKAYMKSIQLKPDFSPAYQHLAECLSSEGRFVEALTYADLLIGRVPYCTGAYYLRGSLHSHLDQDNLAYSDFKTALELGPNNPDTYVQFGGACVGIKEYSEAIEACEKAVKLDPKKAAGCLYRIGLALEKSGNYNKAIDYYQNAKTHSSGIFAKWCDERIFECRNHLK